MKGTLLLLALLVTGELGFQTTEACLSFFEAFAGMASGNKALMNLILSKFEPTGQEREAFEKLQECYNGLGLSGKLLDAKVMEAILLSPECRNYYTTDMLDKIKKVLSKLTSM
ncbi:androgen-binding protein homolog [Peromyscus maniculatus bairdii]|uniref:Androgen-binding protein homolog n=1 Tax=Peromyscus maniculatus bairdii TaxID=230844 RepID=A0A8C8TUH1_PERMB|nr:androgen-binding protein homolog isoform X2 [Peromyscus maniculatus bairdii]